MSLSRPKAMVMSVKLRLRSVLLSGNLLKSTRKSSTLQKPAFLLPSKFFSIVLRTLTRTSSSLSKIDDDATLKVEVTKLFSEYGECFTKIKRDHKQTPFAFCQFTVSKTKKACAPLLISCSKLHTQTGLLCTVTDVSFLIAIVELKWLRGTVSRLSIFPPPCMLT